MMDGMRAWWVRQPGPISGAPLVFGERPRPEPVGAQIRVAVTVCGVCRTDLHLAEGDLAPRRPDVIPGHEVVGRVDATGPDVNRFAVGDRVGVAWLHSTCGACRFCRQGKENLCLAPTFTGWDVDGGYAEFAVVGEQYAYAIPPEFDDLHAAPLLCAGIIGYRALRTANCPPGGRLGIYGFGGSAHLAAQIAIHQGARVHVMTRSTQAQRLALELGVASAGDATDTPPEPLDAAVLFAPVGDLVPTAMRALDRGGCLAIAGIHLTDIPSLNYQDTLFQERVLRSVTANTRQDGDEFLALAARFGLEVTAHPYPLEQADTALQDLATDQFAGAAVLDLTAD